jgi:hypothetical protein
MASKRELWEGICGRIRDLGGRAQLSDFVREKQLLLAPMRWERRRSLGWLEDACLLPVWLDQHGYYHAEENWRERLQADESPEALHAHYLQTLKWIRETRDCQQVHGGDSCHVWCCHQAAQHFTDAEAAVYCARQRLEASLAEWFHETA